LFSADWPLSKEHCTLTNKEPQEHFEKQFGAQGRRS